VRYDPNAELDVEAWRQLGEDERLASVIRYHEAAGELGESMRVHAVVHTTVESQLAEGLPAASSALERLLREELTRHEAVHAIGSVVAGQIYQALKGVPFDASEYDRRLAELTAATWRQIGQEE
jgi:uncharacterized protein with beta-barrel porin domain